MSKKLFGKLSAADCIIILVIVAALVAAAVKFLDLDSSIIISADEEITYTVKISGVRLYSANAVSVGDKFYEPAGGIFVGEVAEVHTEPYTEIVKRQDGTYFVSEVPERHIVYITFKCSGKISDAGFFLGGSKQLSAGADFIACSNRFYIYSGSVESISR